MKTGKDEESVSFKLFHNLHSTDTKAVAKEFEEHDKTYRKRGKVYLYHEMLSFSPLDKEHLTTEVLKDITEKFISLRGERSLVVATVHSEKAHMHVHCVFSAVQYRQSKSTRISKSKFLSIRQELERYQMKKYPQIEHSICYLNQQEKNKILRSELPDLELTDKEQEFKKRTGKTTNKEVVSELVKSLYLKSDSLDDFLENLIQEGLTVYKYKQKVNGILFKGKKFRFRTLSITDEHILLLQKNYNRLKELEGITNQKQHSKDRGNDLSR